MAIADLYKLDLHEGLESLREILVRAEDKLAEVFACPASLPLYDYEHPRTGEIRQRIEIREAADGGRRRRHRQSVAYVNFDGVSLTLERYWYPKDELTKKEKHSGKRTFWHPDDPKFDDVLALEVEDSFWMCEVVRLLPAMNDRLVEDAKVDPEEIRATTDRLNAWLVTMKANQAFRKTDG